MARTKGELIKCNYEAFKGFVKCGAISTTVATHYKIYCYHNSLPSTMPQMEKYSQIAEDFKISESLVRHAIKDMKQKI